jgi:GNAT superfamily N-acetyltransferase
MPGEDDRSPLGEFKYITYGQVDQLDSLHPLYHKYIPNEKYERLIDCPDISDDFPWFFYIADDERIYSHLSAIPDVLHAEGKTYRWAWTGDLVTDPKFRGRGLAKRVVEETIKILHQRNFIAGGGFATEVTIHIYKKLGFALPGYVSRHLFLKSLRPVLEYHIKPKTIRSIADMLYRVLIFLARPFLRPSIWPRRQRVALTRLNTGDGTATDLELPGPRYQTRFHFNDSIAKVLWKIGWTRHDTRLYLMAAEKTKEPLGYFVLREKQVREPILGKYSNFNLMTLMDYGFFKNDETLYRALIDRLSHLFWKSSAHVLEIVSSSDILNGYARRIGMKKVGKGVPFLILSPPDCDLGDHREAIENWHLTHYSGEGFLMR